MKLAKPSIPVVYVQAKDRDGKSRGITLYDTTPTEVIDFLRRRASVPSVADADDDGAPSSKSANPKHTDSAHQRQEK